MYEKPQNSQFPHEIELYVIHNIHCINVQLIQKHDCNGTRHPNTQRIRIREVVESPPQKIIRFLTQSKLHNIPEDVVQISGLSKNMVKRALLSQISRQ